MNILSFFSPKTLLGFLPMILAQVGSYLKTRDQNDTGRDDAAANLITALADALAAMQNNNDNAFRKALTVARDTINTYLGQSVPTT